MNGDAQAPLAALAVRVVQSLASSVRSLADGHSDLTSDGHRARCLFLDKPIDRKKVLYYHKTFIDKRVDI